MFCRREASDRGSAIIEFALVLPLLAMLVFGIFQFGVYFNRSQGLNAAAREGARVGAIPSSTVDDITARVSTAMAGIGLETPHTVEITPTGAGDFRPCENRAGQSIVVLVETEMTITIPGTGIFGPAAITDQKYNLTGNGEFRCE